MTSLSSSASSPSARSFHWRGVTHTGCKRSENQDAVAWWPSLSAGAVADGIGGHADGARASSLALESVYEALAERASIEMAVRRAHETVMRNGEAGMHRMGTTLVVAQYDTQQALWRLAWAGDSRAYGWTEEQGLQLLTHDHSLVQEMCDQGYLQEEEKALHPQRNVITQAVGINDPLRYDVTSWKPQGPHRLLLCTDGLHGVLTPTLLAELCRRAETERCAVETLLAATLKAGAPDNVGIVACWVNTTKI